MGSLISRGWESMPALFDDNGFYRLRRLMDRAFDEPMTGQPLAFQTGMYVPACDQEETESHYLFTLDVPGIAKDAIHVNVSGNQLTISGERKEEARGEQNGERYIERRTGTFSRTFNFPTAVEAEEVEANYENGVLRIAVPKTEASKKSRVKIAEGKSGVFSKLLNKSKERAA
ncbi:MAG: Hsp20/alpha crystallin family protein [Bdellovibrionales bacterium]|nr:Hsp20/alpha crystallin family protein [Bdellovibrionales bacterium]